MTDKNIKYFIGILLIIISSLFFSAFLMYFHNIIKKYKYYLDLAEIIGYMGFYCCIFLFIIILILNYSVKSEKINYPTGNKFFILIFKCIISSFICDFSLILLFKYFNVIIIAQIFLLLIGILSAVYMINYFIQKNETNTKQNSIVNVNNEFFFILEGSEIINLIILIYGLKKKFDKIKVNQYTYSKIFDKKNNQ